MTKKHMPCIFFMVFSVITTMPIMCPGIFIHFQTVSKSFRRIMNSVLRISHTNFTTSFSFYVTSGNPLDVVLWCTFGE